MVHDSELSSIDLNLLLILRALLRERHVTRAARMVGRSQSAASHALSRLRELCDDPLLVRRGRVLQLTPRAERMLPRLERGLSDLQSVVSAEPEFDPRTARRLFTLGLADYPQAVLVGPLLRELENVAPHIDLSALSHANIARMLEEGRFDLGVVISETVPDTLSTQALFTDGFVCMVRQGHPLTKGKLSLEKYLSVRHVLVAPGGGPGSLVDTELERRGLERRVALRVSNFLVAPMIVSETDFMSTAPRLLAERVAKRFRLHLMPPPLRLPTFGLSLAWHPRLDHDPAQRWLRSFVTRVSTQQ